MMKPLYLDLTLTRNIARGHYGRPIMENDQPDDDPPPTPEEQRKTYPWDPNPPKGNPWERLLKREREKIEKEYAAKGEEIPDDVAAKFHGGIDELSEWYTEIVVPMVKNKKATAEDLHIQIMDLWDNAYKRRGFPEEYYQRSLKLFNSIRKEWYDQPEAFFYQDQKDFEVIDSDTYWEMRKDIERNGGKHADKMLERLSRQWKLCYYHRLNREFGFPTEKDHLAGAMAWQLTQGEVGSANQFDPRATFGSIQWQYAPDTGGEAHAMDWEMKKKAKEQREKDNMEKNSGKLADAGGSVGGIGNPPDERKGPGSAGRGKFSLGDMGPPSGINIRKLRRRPKGPDGAPSEDIEMLAAALTDDVNDTWRHDNHIMNDEWVNRHADVASANRYSDVDYDSLLPSDVRSMGGYAVAMEGVDGPVLYHSQDRHRLIADPGINTACRRGRARIVESKSINVDDNDFILNGGRVVHVDTIANNGHSGNGHSGNDYQIADYARAAIDTIRECYDDGSLLSGIKEVAHDWIDIFMPVVESCDTAVSSGLMTEQQAIRVAGPAGNFLYYVGMAHKHTGSAAAQRESLRNMVECLKELASTRSAVPDTIVENITPQARRLANKLSMAVDMI